MEPPLRLQWWRGLSAVERMLTRWSSGREGGGEESESERTLLGTINNEGSRAAPAPTLRSTSPHTLDEVAAYMAKTFPGL